MNLARQKIQKIERRLVSRCLLESSVLICSEDDMLHHPLGFSGLVAFRFCVSSIGVLLSKKVAVSQPNVKLTAIIEYGGELANIPLINELSTFCVDDNAARAFWRGRIPMGSYPHMCPQCDSACFIGFNQIDCRLRCGENF